MIQDTIKIKIVDSWAENDIGYLQTILSNNFNIKYVEDDPDFILCSCFGNTALNYDCPRIFYTGEAITPDFNIYDYALGFDDMLFGDRYLRLPLWLLYNSSVKRASQKHLLDDKFLLDRKFCNFVVSNGQVKEREVFFYLLSQYKKVDSGGRFLNNIGGPVDNKYEFQKKYKFSITFENGCYDGYITEKILEAWGAGTIPIYWGARDISKEFNPKAFINCADFDSFGEVCEYVKEIDNDNNKYLSIMHEPIFIPGTRAYEQYIANNLQYIVDFFNNIFIKKNTLRRNQSYKGIEYERNKFVSLSTWKFPTSKIDNNLHKIVIWGSGDVGRDYVKQFKTTESFELVAVVDSNLKENEKINGCAVISPIMLKDLEYDAIVIAVKREKTCVEIKDKIHEMEITQPIFWWEPEKRI